MLAEAIGQPLASSAAEAASSRFSSPSGSAISRAMSNFKVSEKPPLALIAGPTASGKSALAVRLGQAIEERGGRAAIINADSAQVYADLKVLSARPTHEEMGGIRHHLFGAWDGAEACSAADWSAAARVEIEHAHGEGAIPILVGGTGLYFRTLLDGIAPIPDINDDIRAAVRAMPQCEARSALEDEDPQAAARLAPRDNARTARALEVVRSTGKPIAHWQSARSGGIGSGVDLRPVVLMPDRDWLYQRCDRRFETMLETGAKEEVTTLLERQLPPQLPVMRAIGVREIADLLHGRVSPEDALLAGCASTRRYAKRQFTWFRHQIPPSWLKLESENYLGKSFDELLFHFLP